MGRVSIAMADDRPPWRTRDMLEPERHSQLNESELESDMLRSFPTTDEHLELFELSLPPHADVSPHAHDVDEIIYVLSGELLVGAKHIGPGSAIYVEAETLYAFRVGPEGCAFLNFRPRPYCLYLTKSEFMQRRDERRGAGVDTDTDDQTG